MRHPSVRSRASLAILTAAALGAVGVAQAQDKAKPPPPAWHQGKPPSMDASKLAPLPGKMTETSRSEIPVEQDQPAAGVLGPDLGERPAGRARDGPRRPRQDLRRHADHRPGVRGHRQRRPAVGPRRRRQAHPAGRASRSRTARSTSWRSTGCCATTASRATPTPSRSTSPTSSSCRPSSITTGSTSAFGPDKKLYVPFGAPCNICEPPAQYAQIRRYNPDGSGMEVIARGVRNTVRASTGIRRPASCGSPTTAATGWATTARRTS